MIFDKKEFPLLTSTTPSTKHQMTAPNLMPPPNSQPNSMATLVAAYDYQAELDRITAEIENNLKKKFDDLFAQIESKITKLVEQQVQQYEEQQKVNAQNAKQLAWVINI